MTISQNLKDLISANSEETVDVVLVFDDYEKKIISMLEKAGFESTGDIAEAGIIYGKINLQKVKGLKKIPGLISIELDETQIGFDFDFR